MDKILIEITNKEILFSYCNKDITDITKLEDANSLVLTENIIKENHKQISKYLSEKNINTIAVTHISLIKIAILLTYHYPIYENLIIKENAPLTKDIAITLMHPSMKYKIIKCHSLPKEAKNLLEQKGLTIITTNALPFESTLMLKNSFKAYNDIEKKEILIIDFPLNKYDLEDFSEFLQTNKNLKTIELKSYNYNSLVKLIKILNQNNKQKITINIYEKDENVFLDLTNLKHLKKKYKIKLKIIYSKEYIQKNRKKQIIKNIIIISLIITIAIITYFLLFPYQK